MKEQCTLVALGSSFAAGPGITPVADVNAMRSSRNYPKIAADRIDAELVDLTVTGATIGNILSDVQTVMSGVRFAPQIDGVPEGADIVTITAGGNDLSYIGSMVYAASEQADPDGPITAMLRQEFGSGLPVPSDDAIDGTAQRLAKVVASVEQKAPHARVILVDYLTVISPARNAQAGGWFSPDQTELFSAMQSGLEQVFRRAADASGAELLAASSLSRDHALGSREPWINDFSLEPAAMAGAFHPTATGMEAVAEALVDLLKRER